MSEGHQAITTTWLLGGGQSSYLRRSAELRPDVALVPVGR